MRSRAKLIPNGTTVRLVGDTCGDLPKRYMRRKGVVISRATSQDEGSLTAYMVKFAGRKEPLCLYIDEIEETT